MIAFGDNVRFVDNETTRKARVSCKEGTCLGFTTPSVTNIEFIGNCEDDYAISIELKDSSLIIWASEDLVEFIDHGDGQVMEVGNIRATRLSDGSWKEEKIKSRKEKDGWFKRLFQRK